MELPSRIATLRILYQVVKFAAGEVPGPSTAIRAADMFYEVANTLEEDGKRTTRPLSGDGDAHVKAETPRASTEAVDASLTALFKALSFETMTFTGTKFRALVKEFGPIELGKYVFAPWGASLELGLARELDSAACFHGARVTTNAENLILSTPGTNLFPDRGQSGTVAQVCWESDHRLTCGPNESWEIRVVPLKAISANECPMLAASDMECVMVDIRRVTEQQTAKTIFFVRCPL